MEVVIPDQDCELVDTLDQDIWETHVLLYCPIRALHALYASSKKFHWISANSKLFLTCLWHATKSRVPDSWMGTRSLCNHPAPFFGGSAFKAFYSLFNEAPMFPLYSRMAGFCSLLSEGPLFDLISRKAISLTKTSAPRHPSEFVPNNQPHFDYSSWEWTLHPTICLPDSLFQRKELSPIEKELFQFYAPPKNGSWDLASPSPLFVDLPTWLSGMEKNFAYSSWEHAIDWEKWVLCGGSVLRHALADPRYFSHSIPTQDLDFFSCGMARSEYTREIDRFMKEMECFHPVQDRMTHTTSVATITVTIPTSETTSIRLEFQFINSGKSTHEQVFQMFDLDCCQIGWTGQHIISTFAFVHSISTGTMVNFKTDNHPTQLSRFFPRTIKYVLRGWDFLVPLDFDHKDYQTQCLETWRRLNKFQDHDPNEVITAFFNMNDLAMTYVAELMQDNYPSMLLGNSDSYDVRQKFFEMIEKKVKVFRPDWVLIKPQVPPPWSGRGPARGRGNRGMRGPAGARPAQRLAYPHPGPMMQPMRGHRGPPAAYFPPTVAQDAYDPLLSRGQGYS